MALWYKSHNGDLAQSAYRARRIVPEKSCSTPFASKIEALGLQIGFWKSGETVTVCVKDKFKSAAYAEF
jgi:hypothetical protein